MKTIYGDLIEYGKKGTFDVIVHGCNCFHTMGGGIARAIKQEFPEAYKADLLTHKADPSKLGTYSYAKVNNLIIVNAYTQYDFGGKMDVDYEALRTVFKRIAKDFHGLRIGYPKIGAGLAGGDWDVIYPIICKALDKEDHTLVLFE